ESTGGTSSRRCEEAGLPPASEHSAIQESSHAAGSARMRALVFPHVFQVLLGRQAAAARIGFRFTCLRVDSNRSRAGIHAIGQHRCNDERKGDDAGSHCRTDVLFHSTNLLTNIPCSNATINRTGRLSPRSVDRLARSKDAPSQGQPCIAFFISRRLHGADCRLPATVVKSSVLAHEQTFRRMEAVHPVFARRDLP